MKKALSLILALVLCLSLCACGGGNKENEKDDLVSILCSGTWVSYDHIFVLDNINREFFYTTLRFYDDGTCEHTAEDYRDGKLTETSTFREKWKIEDGKIAVFPGTVDSDSDTIYFEYADGMLIGSAWYDDSFTYTHKQSDKQEQHQETTDEKYKKAVAFYEAKQYEDALDIFNEIPEYLNSSEYRSSCEKIIAEIHAPENFSGYFHYECKDTGYALNSSGNNLLKFEWNPYDQFYVDFETKTITMYHTKTQKEQVNDFVIISSTLLKTNGFRSTATSVYWHFVDGEVYLSFSEELPSEHTLLMLRGKWAT